MLQIACKMDALEQRVNALTWFWSHPVPAGLHKLIYGRNPNLCVMPTTNKSGILCICVTSDNL